MTHDVLVDKMNEHDRKLDKFEMGMEHLADSLITLSNNVGATVRKMEDLAILVSQQNVLMEKFANLDGKLSGMDDELRASFVRMYKRIESVEAQQNTDGCSALKQLAVSKDLYDEKLKVCNNRINDLESSQKWLVRSIIGVVLLSILKLVLLGV